MLKSRMGWAGFVGLGLAISALASAGMKKPHPTPWDTFQQLILGNERFVSKKTIHRAPSSKNAGKHSGAGHVVVLTCSDLTPEPAQIFDQQSSNITVLRIGAHDSAERIAQVEGMVKKKDASLVVVMGHENCRHAQLRRDGKARVSSIARQLASESPSIQKKIADSKLGVVQAFFVPATRSVEFWDLTDEVAFAP